MESISEKAQDFTSKRIVVKLTNGLEVIITTPKLGWYYDFLMPRLNIAQLMDIGKDARAAIKEQVQGGNVSLKTLKSMPIPIASMVLAIIAFYIPDNVYKGDDMPEDKDKLFDYKIEYCKKELELVDALAIINALLHVADARRIIGFFDKIGEVTKESKPTKTQR